MRTLPLSSTDTNREAKLVSGAEANMLLFLNEHEMAMQRMEERTPSPRGEEFLLKNVDIRCCDLSG